MSRSACLTLVLALAPAALQAQPVVKVNVELAEGDVPIGAGGDAVTFVGGLDVSADGDLAITVQIKKGIASEGAVLINGEVVWRESQGFPFDVLGTSLTHPSVAGTTSFAIEPKTDGDDSIWLDGSLFLREGNPVPGLGGETFDFLESPRLLPSGAVYLSGGFIDPIEIEVNDFVFHSPTGAVQDLVPVLGTGDTVQGFDVTTINSFYISNGGQHLAASLTMDTNNSNDTFMVLDGQVVAREGLLTSEGDRWAGFSSPRVNSEGTVVFRATTDYLDDSADSVIVVDGTIALRESHQMPDPPHVTAPASPLNVEINDRGQILHHWLVDDASQEYLWFSCDENLRQNSVPILGRDWWLDVDDDDIAEGIVDSLYDFLFQGPPDLLRLGEEGLVYMRVRVDFDDGQPPYWVILSIPHPECPVFTDGFESGDTSQWGQ